jgi:hypothetical protein
MPFDYVQKAGERAELQSRRDRLQGSDGVAVVLRVGLSDRWKVRPQGFVAPYPGGEPALEGFDSFLEKVQEQAGAEGRFGFPGGACNLRRGDSGPSRPGLE